MLLLPVSSGGDNSCKCNRKTANVALRVRRSFSVQSETKPNGIEILFPSKRNRGDCFALKRNSRFHMRNEMEMKRNEARKQNETKLKKRSERNKAEKNIL